jgi:hypothetical protein
VNKAAEPVGQAGGFGGEVVVEADDHLQFGDGGVVQVERAQGVGHGAGCVRDDECVAGIGLGLAGIEVGYPPHRQAGQIGDLEAHVAGDGQRQGPDRGRLVDDHEDPCLACSFAKTSRSMGSLLGSRLSKAFLPAGVTAAAWCSPLPTSRPR